MGSARCGSLGSQTGVAALTSTASGVGVRPTGPGTLPARRRMTSYSPPEVAARGAFGSWARNRGFFIFERISPFPWLAPAQRDGSELQGLLSYRVVTCQVVYGKAGWHGRPPVRDQSALSAANWMPMPQRKPLPLGTGNSPFRSRLLVGGFRAHRLEKRFAEHVGFVIFITGLQPLKFVARPRCIGRPSGACISCRKVIPRV